MIRTLIIALLCSFAFHVVAQDSKQEVDIKKSTDKVKIEGKYYFIHIVRKGETLYSISKVYNVSQIEIAMENPDIYLGLQVDQALKIPISDSVEEPPKGNEDDNYIYHVVRKGETLFGLSKKYQVSMDELIRVNPEVEKGIKLSQVVLIPKEKLETLGDETPEVSDRFIYHEVKPKEGFYSITKQYNVSEETVRRFNAELVKDGVKLGTILRIPRNPSDTLLPEMKTPGNQAAIEQSNQTITDELSVVCDTFTYNNQKNIFNVALFLPLFVYEFENPPVDSLAMEEMKSRGETLAVKQEVPEKSSNFIDFYQGVLVAIDSLKQLGLSVNLTVFDTGKDVDSVKYILNQYSLKETDLIIGPVYPECIKPVAEFARENRIPIVSPLSQSSYLLNENPYIFQANPSFITQLEGFSKQIDLCKGQNIVIIHEGDTTAKSMVNTYKELLQNRMASCSNPEYIYFKEVTYEPGSPAADVVEKVSHSLSLEKENLILVPSNSEAFVSDLLGNLHTLATYYQYPLSIYGLPRWQKFRNVQVDYYYNLQLHLFSPFFIDYSNPTVKSFIVTYRDFFRSEPSQYSYQGYDVAFYFLSAMMKYGYDFKYCLQNHKVEMVQSEFNFSQPNSVSGFENRTIYMINYTKDFEQKLDDSYRVSTQQQLQYQNEEPYPKQGVVVK